MNDLGTKANLIKPWQFKHDKSHTIKFDENIACYINCNLKKRYLLTI